LVLNLLKFKKHDEDGDVDEDVIDKALDTLLEAKLEGGLDDFEDDFDDFEAIEDPLPEGEDSSEEGPPPKKARKV